MSEAARILVVEDELLMQRLMQSYLQARGFAVVVAEDGPGALQTMRDSAVDIVLLDIGLPGDMDGIEVCRRLRAATSVPIILVTAAQRPETKITALELGGDDYLVKPFDADELIARIGAVLRRTRAQAQTQAVVRVDELAIDFVGREVRRGSESVHLTKTEFDLLEILIRNPDRTLGYAEILQSVWGDGYSDTRSVQAYVSHLRRKLAASPGTPDRLIPVPGVGYRFRLSG